MSAPGPVVLTKEAGKGSRALGAVATIGGANRDQPLTHATDCTRSPCRPAGRNPVRRPKRRNLEACAERSVDLCHQAHAGGHLENVWPSKPEQAGSNPAARSRRQRIAVCWRLGV